MDKFSLINEEGKEYSTTNFFSLSDSNLEYKINKLDYKHPFINRLDMWKYFNLIPIKKFDNVITLKEGMTPFDKNSRN